MPSLVPSRRSPQRRIWLIGLGLLAAGCAHPPWSQQAVSTTWAHQGRLRVAINHGNAVLARRDPSSGELSGVSVDIARELARRLHIEVELLAVDAANKSVEAVRGGQADVGFFAIDPLRSDGMAFTAPYVVIEGAYAVRQSSPLQSAVDVDRPGVRVVVAAKSAYDLFLNRSLQQASLVKTTRSDQVTDLMMAQQLDVAAGVKQQLERDMLRVPGLRLLQPSFMQIHQAMATSALHPENARYLRRFVEELKATGFVQQSVARHRIEGVTVAPAHPTPDPS